MMNKAKARNIRVMRIIFMLAVFLLSAGPFIAYSQAANDLAEQKLVGKVRSVTEHNFNVVKGQGKLQNEYKGRTKYVYNKRGNKISEQVFNPGGSLDSRTVLNYSPAGLLEQEDGYNGDGTPDFTNIYTYNKDSDLASIRLYNGSGNIFLKTLCSYDAKGNETAETNYTSVAVKGKVKDELLNKTVWQYDAKGNIIKEEFLEGGRISMRTTSYARDSHGNITERADEQNGITQKITYKYDAKGLLIEETHYDGYGTIEMKIVTTYDEHGNEAEQDYLDKDDRMQAVSIYKLTYDKQGNWIRKVQSDNERTTGIVDREIEYY